MKQLTWRKMGAVNHPDENILASEAYHVYGKAL
jgi:hypothetical protein